MYTLSVIDSSGLIELERFESIEEALADTRRMWMEDDGAEAHFVVRGESGNVLATLTRVPEEPETCITVLYLTPVPTVERHRCRYLHDADGRYLGPEVTELAAELVG